MYSLILTDYNRDLKIATIKAVRGACDLSLRDALDLVNAFSVENIGSIKVKDFRILPTAQMALDHLLNSAPRADIVAHIENESGERVVSTASQIVPTLAVEDLVSLSFLLHKLGYTPEQSLSIIRKEV